jgi:chromosome segregation ATPase
VTEDTRIVAVALITGLPAILAAVVSLKNRQGQKVMEVQAHTNDRKARGRSKRMMQAVADTNGNFDAANERIASLDKQLAEALSLLVDFRKEVAELKAELIEVKSHQAKIPQIPTSDAP